MLVLSGKAVSRPLLLDLVSVSLMTLCILCNPMPCSHQNGPHDLELLLPSITASVAVGPPFPLHSSPLRKQSAVEDTSQAIGSMQCRWQDQIHATPYPKPTEATTTLSSTMIYCRRKLEQSSNKSNNCVAVEKEIRRKKCPSKPGTIPNSAVYMNIRFSSLHLPHPSTRHPLCCFLLTQVYHELLAVDGLLPVPTSSVWLAEKASQEEISNPITRGASTSAAGAPQSEC